MAAKSELKELERQRREIAERIGEIETERDSKQTAQYVGRFFRGSNNYSCPKDATDYWPWYFKCTGNEGRFVKGFSFQRDKYGRSSTETKNYMVLESHGMEEITRSQWDIAWQTFLAKLTADEAK